MMARRLSQLLSADYPPDSPIAWRGAQFLCLQDLRNRAAAVAARYSGSHAVALHCQDSYHFTAGFYGLLHAGCRIVLPPAGPSCDTDTLHANIDAIADDAAITSAPASPFRLTPIDPTAEHICFFTSGSTGAPKQIVKTLGMFEQETLMFEQRFGAGLTSQSRIFATVPHQHLYGLSFKLMWPLAFGRPFCADTHLFWESLLNDLTADAVIVSSPAHLSRLTGLVPRKEICRPRRLFTSGAPLSRAASDDAATLLGCRPTEIFGSTETGAIASRDERRGEDDPWHTLPGVTVRTGTDGCLSVFSPAAGSDWSPMADLVTLTGDGFIYRGRTDRIVKIEGKRINLICVEDALRQHPLLSAVAVTTLTNPLRVAAVVVPTQDGKALLEQTGPFRFARALRKDLQQTLEPAGIPRQWRFVEALPSHPMGKQRQADIRALFGATP